MMIARSRRPARGRYVGITHRRQLSVSLAEERGSLHVADWPPALRESPNSVFGFV
jgi:hypothetical protein